MNDLFWSNITKIQNSFSFSDEQIADMLEVTQGDFSKYMAKGSIPEINKLDNLLLSLGLSIGEFFDESLNLTKVHDYLNKEELPLPEKYSVAKLSKSRAIQNVLSCIEFKYGSELKHFVLKELNINPAYFEDQQNSFNIFVVKDICNILRNSANFTEQDFYEMGLWSYVTNRQTLFGRKLSSYRDTGELYQAICEEHSKSFEYNFSYDLVKTTSDSVQIEVKETEMLKDLLSTHSVNDNDINKIREGVIASFPRYLSQNNAESRIISETTGNNAKTLFEFTFQ